MKWIPCGSLRFDHFDEAAAGLLWAGWGTGMADRHQIVSAVSLFMDSGMISALTFSKDRVCATGKGVWEHFGIGGPVGQDGRVGRLVEMLVKQGFGDLTAKLYSRCARALRFWLTRGFGTPRMIVGRLSVGLGLRGLETAGS